MIKPQIGGSKKGGTKKAIKTNDGVKIIDDSSEFFNNSTTEGAKEPKAMKKVRWKLEWATLKWCPKQESQSNSKETGSDIPDTQDELMIKL